MLHCLPHNCTADALASTGAFYRKDHLGIFRFGNLRMLGCDWLLWPHDNLGRKCSCVLSPSVSLEGSWGVFGGLGRPLSFNITGKQRNGEKLNISNLYTLAWLSSCWTFHPLLPFGSVRTADWGICSLEAALTQQNCSNQVGSYQTRTAFGCIWSFSSSPDILSFFSSCFSSLYFNLIISPALFVLH